MKHISLTRSRQIEAVCWALVLLASFCAHYFPVRTLPAPLRLAVAAVLVCLGGVIIATSFGLFTEKGDERSTENERRADAALFTLFFLLMGALLFLTEDGQVYTVGRSEVLVLFALVCLARNLLFLGYERFSS